MKLLGFEQKYFLLHLSLIDGVGPATVEHIIDKISEPLDVDLLYRFTQSDWQHTIQLTPHMANLITTGLADIALREKELETLAKYNISWTTCYEADYPAPLRAIAKPPTILYWQGQLPAVDKTCVALVGSRKSNDYGSYVAKELVKDLVYADACTVSGGALGIDSIVHQETVHAGGYTMAILGSGLLKPYPANNKKLFDHIIANNGAVCSTFALNTPAHAGNFPARNRVIAGLAHACVVLQAAKDSGSLITAQYALEQGKEVGAVPGPIYDPLSVGCHQLLAQGATLITKGTDILDALGVAYGHTSPTRADETVTQDPHMNLVISLCRKPILFDELLLASNMAKSELSGMLLGLQLEGLIEQTVSGHWLSC